MHKCLHLSVIATFYYAAVLLQRGMGFSAVTGGGDEASRDRDISGNRTSRQRGAAACLCSFGPEVLGGEQGVRHYLGKEVHGNPVALLLIS